MTRFAYVNGRFMRHVAASVHVEDRGFQFADSVYEVCAIRDGLLIDERPHLDRLERSLGELRMNLPVARAALGVIARELVVRNRVRDGLVYMQVSRGRARRDHGFPEPTVRPTLVMTARALDLSRYDAMAGRGVSIITLPEMRWARCDIKSTALLPNVLAKQQAREAGCFEAWFVASDGTITEGASTNAWITRGEILSLCRQHGLEYTEVPFTESDVGKAREAFVTAATIGAMPVVQANGLKIGDGKPGPIARKIREIYWSTRIG
jgi:D-alanine transaminase